MPYFRPRLVPSPLGSLAPRFFFFFSLSGRPERPRTASCPGCRQQRLEQLPGNAPGAVEAGGEGVGGEKRTEQGRKRPRSRGLMLMYGPACVLLPQSSDSSELGVAPVVAAPPLKADAGTASPKPSAGTSGLDDLDLLGKALLQQSLPPESQQVRW